MAAVVAGGEQVILARGAGVPVTYVATWYQRFPVAIFSLDPTIQKPADLVGRKVGLPAESGASYIGWQAFLAANGLQPDSVKTEVVGFMQRDAVLQKRVDAAVGYVVNEPLQLKADGKAVSVMEIADSFNLVSNGLVVASRSIDTRRPIVQGLTTAMLEGIRDTLDDPAGAFEIALKTVPEAGAPSVRATQRQVLDASLRLWDAPELGAINPDAWLRSETFLTRIRLLDHEVPAEGMIDPSFVNAAAVHANR
jgi:NitT/TauT family transport system substrate-binding protein